MRKTEGGLLFCGPFCISQFTVALNLNTLQFIDTAVLRNVKLTY
jgi:hypothetical protein